MVQIMQYRHGQRPMIDRSKSSISTECWETYRKSASACSFIYRNDLSTRMKLLIHARNKEQHFLHTVSATEMSVCHYYQLYVAEWQHKISLLSLNFWSSYVNSLLA